MKVLGIRCSKDRLQWAIVNGSTRQDVEVLFSAETTPPDTDRADQLAWVRKEILELVHKYSPDQAALRVAEGGKSGTASLPRAEVDGVVQAALSEGKVPSHRMYGATVRSAFSAKTSAALDDALSTIPVLLKVAKVRRDPVIAAVARFPA